ncbi:MAG: pentapeptide repeat-containing protein [Chloroflexi bacterium]|nr:pentapeptide repeat-containing protein [Chloroflexota bacterium]
MRAIRLRQGLRAEFLSVLCVVVVMLAVAGCGSEQGASAVTPVGTQRDLRGETVGDGTPIAKAGTPDVQPLPNQIGDCVLERNTECPGADLSNAQLGFRANSTGAGIRIRLDGGNFQNANFSGSDLFSANFTGADLRGANFTDANIAGANMYQADLRGANLTGADISFADMEDAKLEGAIFCNTTMPNGSVNNEGCP